MLMLPAALVRLKLAEAPPIEIGADVLIEAAELIVNSCREACAVPIVRVGAASGLTP